MEYAPDTNVLMGLVNSLDGHNLNATKFFELNKHPKNPIVILPTPFKETKSTFLKKSLLVVGEFVKEMATIDPTVSGVVFTTRLLEIASKIRGKNPNLDSFIELVWSSIQTAKNRYDLEVGLENLRQEIRLYVSGIGEIIFKYNAVHANPFPGIAFIESSTGLFLELKGLKHINGRNDILVIADGMAYCKTKSATATVVTTDNSMIKDFKEMENEEGVCKKHGITLQIMHLEDALKVCQV